MRAIFELEPIAPDHYISANEMYDSDYWSLGMKVLKNGDILIDVGTYEITDTDQNLISSAIVTPSGELRCYLVPGYEIVGEYIVGDDGIYDFDMKSIYSFADEELVFEGCIGEKIIVSKTVEKWEWSEWSEEYYKVEDTEYYVISKGQDTVEKTLIFDEEMLSDDWYGMDAITDDYVITCSKENYNGERKFTLYNANLDRLLTTHGEMQILPIEDGYLVTWYVDGVRMSYTVK